MLFYLLLCLRAGNGLFYTVLKHQNNETHSLQISYALA
jgi:hypothetical protein